jgi:hypothetical protein
MIIEDFKSANDLMNNAEIENALAKRYGEGANEFWLSHADGRFPAMSILVKGNVAALHYFSEDQNPGLISAGRSDLEPNGSTIFYINTEEEKQEIPNGMIVPFSLALEAAMEFFANKEPPRCIEWLAL